MSETSSSGRTVGDAVSDLRDKQTEAEAALAANAPDTDTDADGAANGAAPGELSAASALSATSQLLESYRELVATSARTYGQLPADDPIRAELFEAIKAAREAWVDLLFDGSGGIAESTEEFAIKSAASPAAAATDAEIQADGETAIETEADQPQGSTALVPVTPGPVPAVRVGRRYPDEATLGRFLRRRRARHEWPNEAGIARFLRKRRERGPLYPDEPSIQRVLRRWNEEI